MAESVDLEKIVKSDEEFDLLHGGEEVAEMQGI